MEIMKLPIKQERGTFITSRVVTDSLVDIQATRKIQIIQKPHPNDSLENKIEYQESVYELSYANKEALWRVILQKKEELKELEDKFYKLNDETFKEFEKLLKLKDKTPKGQVLKKKYQLRKLVERFDKYRTELGRIRYIYTHRDYESKRNKEWQMEEKIKKVSEEIEKKILQVNKVVSLHGEHGDTMEWILKEYNSVKNKK